MEAKANVMQGLNAVASDIEATVLLMDQVLFAQNAAVESISAQVQLVQFRLQSMKEQQQAHALDGMKDQSGGVVRRDESSYTDASRNSADMQVKRTAGTSSERMTFEERCSVFTISPFNREYIFVNFRKLSSFLL